MEKIIIKWVRDDGKERCKPVEIRLCNYPDASYLLEDIIDVATMDDGVKQCGHC